jgi:hypothetical protein
MAGLLELPSLGGKVCLCMEENKLCRRASCLLEQHIGTAHCLQLLWQLAVCGAPAPYITHTTHGLVNMHQPHGNKYTLTHTNILLCTDRLLSTGNCHLHAELNQLPKPNAGGAPCQQGRVVPGRRGAVLPCTSHRLLWGQPAVCAPYPLAHATLVPTMRQEASRASAARTHGCGWRVTARLTPLASCQRQQHRGLEGQGPYLCHTHVLSERLLLHTAQKPHNGEVSCCTPQQRLETPCCRTGRTRLVATIHTTVQSRGTAVATGPAAGAVQRQPARCSPQLHTGGPTCVHLVGCRASRTGPCSA